MLRARGYRQVSMPLKMIERIENYVNAHPEQGYLSVPDFLRASARMLFEKLEAEKTDGIN